MIDHKLLDILACPVCRGDVEYDKKEDMLTCVECRRFYPVKDGIPVMLGNQKRYLLKKFMNSRTGAVVFSLTKTGGRIL